MRFFSGCVNRCGSGRGNCVLLLGTICFECVVFLVWVRWFVRHRGKGGVEFEKCILLFVLLCLISLPQIHVISIFRWWILIETRCVFSLLYDSLCAKSGDEK